VQPRHITRICTRARHGLAIIPKGRPFLGWSWRSGERQTADMDHSSRARAKALQECRELPAKTQELLERANPIGRPPTK
jgi:hypothetical protein